MSGSSGVRRLKQSEEQTKPSIAEQINFGGNYPAPASKPKEKEKK